MKKLMTIMAAALLGGFSAMAEDDYIFSADPIVAAPGELCNEVVYFDNIEEVRGFQCDITVSEGLTIDPQAIVLSERADSHDIRTSVLDNGAILVTALNLDLDDLKSIADNEGPLLTIPIQMPEEEGRYTLTLSYIVASVEGVGRVQIPDIEVPITVSITDAVNAVNADENAPVEYFDLQGRRIAKPAHGIYIRRVGSAATKEVVK